MSSGVSIDAHAHVPATLRRFQAPGAGPPPLPVDGVPRQWLPGLVRWPIRVLLLPFVLLDVGCQALVHAAFRPSWKLEGACGKRGHCCHYVLMAVPSFIARFEVLQRIVLLWFTEVHGFFRRGFDAELSPDDHRLVFGCRYLDDRGYCGHYMLRPLVCRTYPNRSYQPPVLLEGCGYRVVARQAQRSRLRILDE